MLGSSPSVRVLMYLLPNRLTATMTSTRSAELKTIMKSDASACAVGAEALAITWELAKIDPYLYGPFCWDCQRSRGEPHLDSCLLKRCQGLHATPTREEP